MKMLEDRIRKDGIVREGNVLKVDSFINHQMDIPLFREMAKEWKRLFDGKPINKVLTIEASGIGIAAVVASEFNVPVVFAKKSMSINLDYDNYETKIQSFTHKKIYNVIVSKKFLTPEDHVLIIDDFAARASSWRASPSSSRWTAPPVRSCSATSRSRAERFLLTIRQVLCIL